MKNGFSESERNEILEITFDLLDGQVEQGIAKLIRFKDTLHASIPEKLKTGRGITWVVERLSLMLEDLGLPNEKLMTLAARIYSQADEDDLIRGVAIFLMAEIGARNPLDVLDFFEKAANSNNWIMREFTQGAFRKMFRPNKELLLPWLKELASGVDPYLRRFASETLRPVAQNKWLNQEPETSLAVLRLMFQEHHPYPRTSVGNNLSDLSRKQPELVLNLVKTLVASGDRNSYWIAYRACRNLVKKDSRRVMEILEVQEYHYKDRNYSITKEDPFPSDQSILKELQT